MKRTHTNRTQPSVEAESLIRSNPASAQHEPGAPAANPEPQTKIRTERDLGREIETAIEMEIETEIKSEIENLEKLVGRIPRWSYFPAVILAGFLFSVLSENLTVGPSWAIPAVVLFLLVPLLTAVFLGHHAWTRRLAFVIISVLTFSLVSSVLFLVVALFQHSESAINLLRDAALLWISNIVVFSIWYWEIDRGGPIRRHTGSEGPADFLFPQMTTKLEGWRQWQPTYSDYVFLAFNTSTAFSPTDTMVLSTWAKRLMMSQASISLVIVSVLAARAINIA